MECLPELYGFFSIFEIDDKALPRPDRQRELSLSQLFLFASFTNRGTKFPGCSDLA